MGCFLSYGVRMGLVGREAVGWLLAHGVKLGYGVRVGLWGKIRVMEWHYPLE